MNANKLLLPPNPLKGEVLRTWYEKNYLII